MSRSLLGINKLRSRLSKVLLGQIAVELPSLIDEIGVKSSACRSRLDKLGNPRATLEEQQLYLFHLSQAFQSLVKAAVDGTYNDPVFGDPKSVWTRLSKAHTSCGTEPQPRLCRQHRQTRSLPPGRRFGNTSRISKDVISITRDRFIDHIQHLMKRTKGRELPGTFNPMIVSDLFSEQSTP